jgi:hypothetical protein
MTIDTRRDRTVLALVTDHAVEAHVPRTALAQAGGGLGVAGGAVLVRHRDPVGNDGNVVTGVTTYAGR